MFETRWQIEKNYTRLKQIFFTQSYTKIKGIIWMQDIVFKTDALSIVRPNDCLNQVTLTELGYVIVKIIKDQSDMTLRGVQHHKGIITELDKKLILNYRQKAARSLPKNIIL